MKKLSIYCLSILASQMTGYLMIFSDTRAFSFGGIILALIIMALVMLQLANFIYSLIYRRVINWFVLPLILLISLVWGISMGEWHLDAQANANKQSASKMVDIIELYITEKGEWPKDLDELKRWQQIDIPELSYGFHHQSFDYSLQENARGYVLSFPDYTTDNIYTYNSIEKKWQEKAMEWAFT